MFSFLHEIVPDIQLSWCLSVEFLIFFWVFYLEDLVFWVVSFADFKFRSVNRFWDSFFVLLKGFQFLGTALFFLLHIIMEFIYEVFGVWLVDSEGYESLDVSLRFLLRFSLFGMFDLLQICLRISCDRVLRWGCVWILFQYEFECRRIDSFAWEMSCFFIVSGVSLPLLTNFIYKWVFLLF